MRDPESARMAAFTGKNSDERAAFDAHMAKNGASPESTNRAITVGGRLAWQHRELNLHGGNE